MIIDPICEVASCIIDEQTGYNTGPLEPGGQIMLTTYCHVESGGAGGAYAPPDFGRSEGAAGQRWRAALLHAPPDF